MHSCHTPPRIPFRITDDRDEMESLGRQIVTANPDIYTDRVVGVIRGHIAKMMPNAPAEDKENIFYRSVYDYWAYGSLIMEEFAYNFFSKTHAQKKEYITKKNFSPYYNHLNDLKVARNLLANKYNAYNYFKNHYVRDVFLLNSETDYGSFALFSEKHPEFVVKPVTFDSGRGIHKESLNDYKNWQDMFNKLRAERDFLEANLPKRDFLSVEHVPALLLEAIIEQVPEMAALHPASLNLLRITTVNVGGKISILYASIKIGRDYHFLNNPAVGGFSAMVNPKTGIVETGLFDEFEHSQFPLERHPNTGFKIIGFQIPRWNEVLSLSEELAKKLETINYVGWDFALTTANGRETWCVVEGNDYGGVVMPQIAYGRGIRSKFEDLIGWKLEKQFWWQ